MNYMKRLSTVFACALFLIFHVCCCLHGGVELDLSSRDFQPDPNHIEIVSSYFGVISRIGDPKYDISIIDENMNVNTEKWKEMCRRVSNNGASAIRMMPYWPPEKEQDVGYMPYVYYNGKYDLTEFNEKYFQNLKQIVEIANSYNLRVYFSMYEACGMRKEFRKYNPWYNNHQMIQDFRHIGPAFDSCRASWERRTYRTLRGRNVGYEIANEPKYGPESLFKVYKRMLRNGIQDSDIIMGVEWDTQTYRYFRNLLLEKYGAEGWVEKKHLIFSTIHGISEEILLEILSEQEGHTRRYWLSADGLHPKPTAAWWEDTLAKFFKIVPTAPFLNQYAFETMHKITKEDDFDSALGISGAIFKHTGKWPKNYGKFPKEEPPAITIKSPNGGEAWEVGSLQTITWATTGKVENVKIQYSMDNGNIWTTIIGSTANDGSYAWTLPNNPSDNCLVRISETDGSPVDTSDTVFKFTKTTNNCESCFKALLEKIESKYPGVLDKTLKAILKEIMEDK